MLRKITFFTVYFCFSICTSCGGSDLSPSEDHNSSDQSGIDTGSGSNDPRLPELFSQWCGDSDTAIQKTVDSIRTSVGAASCEDTGAAYVKRGNKALMLYAPGVSNLRPLSAFPDLKLLGIQHSAVTDFSPLARLPALETLVVSADGNLVDLSTLGSARTITSLTIENFKSVDLAPLAKIPQLEALALKSGSLVNSQELAGMKLLKQLSLVDLGLTSLTFLPPEAPLSSLDVGKNAGLTSLAPVATYKLLASLRVPETAVTDFSPISALSSLNLLDISGADGAGLPVNLAQLAALTKLSALHANNRTLNNLSGLVMLPLRYLYVRRTGLEDFTDIGKISSLQYLDGSGNTFADTVDVTSLPLLRILNLSGCGLNVFPALKGLTTLAELYLADNTIADLGVLPSNLTLKKLSMARNNLSEVDGISGQSKLVEADFSGNKIGQIENLQDLPELRQLNLRENPLSADRRCPMTPLLKCLF